MSEWSVFISEIQKHLSTLEDAGCDAPFFRGHSDINWKLLCGLGRQNPEDFKKKNIESILYYDFTALAGPLLDRPSSSWDVLFSMQHHGLPTRLLDWSTTFSVALYFALKPYRFLKSFPDKAANFPPVCIWVLNPFELNAATMKYETVLNPDTDLDSSYWDYFISDEKKFPGDVIALSPVQVSRRQAVQRSVFTFHSHIFDPLEVSHSNLIKKFVLPASAIPEGFAFLELAGIHEYSLFPDLDGLSRYLKGQHVDWLDGIEIRLPPII